MNSRTRLWLIVAAVTLVSVIALAFSARVGQRLRAECEAAGGSSHWDRDGYRCIKDGQSLEVSP
jgi:hypothetical protein